MRTVNVKKGWRFKISGVPAQKIEESRHGNMLASTPDRFPFVKPRLKVKKGEQVKTGTVLFEDKKNSSFQFLSPGSGTIAAIDFGPRRVITEIIIECDDSESWEQFEAFDANAIDNLDRKFIVSYLLNGGMWPSIRQLPFRSIADPESEPTDIWISIDSSDPFFPLSSVYLEGQVAFFEQGINILKKLSACLNICSYKNHKNSGKQIKKLITHNISGWYPATDPGVISYHTKKSVNENRAWYIDGQDVIRIGKLFLTGKYPVERVVTVSDGNPVNSFHLKTRIGAQLKSIYPEGIAANDKRWVLGGVLSGQMASPDQFLGHYDASLTLIKETDQSEFFGFVRPGFDKLSNSRTVLSWFSKKPIPVNTDMHGEVRPCVNCGFCTAICPVDILPQYTYKSIIADELEDTLSHGLLDCTECGLCSFVCPSKIELSESLIQARRLYYKEIN